MLKNLGSKEKKLLLKQLESQYNFSGRLDYNFFINPDKKIFILNSGLQVDFTKIRINSLGLYFASLEPELRLTIEGSQIIGPSSDKNILEINDNELQDWMHGKDLSVDMESKKDFNGFVLIKNKKDFYGSGKYKQEKVLNYIPKERRLKN